MQLRHLLVQTAALAVIALVASASKASAKPSDAFYSCQGGSACCVCASVDTCPSSSSACTDECSTSTVYQCNGTNNCTGGKTELCCGSCG
jgi:hypothetical protein